MIRFLIAQITISSLNKVLHVLDKCRYSDGPFSSIIMGLYGTGTATRGEWEPSKNLQKLSGLQFSARNTSLLIVNIIYKSTGNMLIVETIKSLTQSGSKKTRQKKLAHI